MNFRLITYCLFGISLCLSAHKLIGQTTLKVYGIQDVYDFAPDEPDSVIEARISTLNTDTNNISVVFNDKVRTFIDYFSIRKRDYSRLMLQREDTYFPIFEFYLKKYGLPDNLKYLTVVESGINPTAKSRAGALGLWQFMPSTGKMFQLDYDFYVDERMDPYKATDAACRYLKELHRMFDDWELALAAYNCGPGNVRRAIRKSGYKKTFWEIYAYLPRETRSYVPQFMAVNYVLPFADEHNIYTDKREVLPEFKEVVINQYFNLEEFARQTDICLKDLLALNPEIKRNAITTVHKDYHLRVPIYSKTFFDGDQLAYLDSAKKKGKEQLNHKPAYSASSSTAGKGKIIYTVRSGDVVGSIASRYGVRQSDLRAWNGIPSNNMIRVGQRLTIYKDPSYFKATTPRATQVAKVAPSTLPKGKTYTVQPGDTLWSISKKYQGLTIDQIKKLNNLNSDNLKPGQTLKLS